MPQDSESSPCCAPGAESAPSGGRHRPWINGSVSSGAGAVPHVATRLRFADRLGGWLARWGIGRMSYRVEPGLYAVGEPTAASPVLVTANYKMSFDRLRAALAGRDAWIMVLDTRGINVWCAAGAGTFGTDEVVRRAKEVRLGDIVAHRTLVLPQLSATGVRGHEVQKRSGFRVAYGPVRAEDLPAFLDAGMNAAPEMRRVRFPLGTRVALVPVELVMSAKYALFAAACFLLLSGLGPGGYSTARVGATGLASVGLLLGAWFAGIALTAALLPWLPGRAFSLKGAWVGLALLLGLGAYAWTHRAPFEDRCTAAAWILIVPALTSFMGMNFTGSTPFTSLSGVRREMRIAVPAQILLASVGLALWLIGRFV
ncbi:MAG: mercury methylation corrinoid protein HgcA [Planctomycetota bacterium]|jgi:acetyl-CoA decarbonylase/synthase complex subunit gamma